VRGRWLEAHTAVGLINCALNLSRQMGPAEERAESDISRGAALSVRRWRRTQVGHLDRRPNVWTGSFP